MNANDYDGIKYQLEDAFSTRIFFKDLHGRMKTVNINPDDIGDIIENGVGIDGSSIPGLATVDNSDRVLKPVPESFRLVDFGDVKIGFFAGSVYEQDGSRSGLDPRYILEKAVDTASEEFGFRFITGPEHEFFLLQDDEFGEDIHSDALGYFSSAPTDAGDAVRQDIVNILAECGIKYEKTHHEVTSSQHEVNLEAGDPLSMADRTLLFEFVTKEVAARHGLHATFMSKPFTGENRNAFHIHLSILDNVGDNICHDPDKEYGLSETLMHFIGGVTDKAREISILLASTVNSYKAYVLDKEAPVIRGWGLRNRSSMVRIPHAKSTKATRMELRCADPAGNVYLQFAGLINAGLEGIRKGTGAGKPDSGSTYKKSSGRKVYDRKYLPRDFFEALMEAERSGFLKGMLGEELYKNYMTLKVNEWEEYRTTITDFEHNKYLSI